MSINICKLIVQTRLWFFSCENFNVLRYIVSVSQFLFISAVAFILSISYSYFLSCLSLFAKLSTSCPYFFCSSLSHFFRFSCTTQVYFFFEHSSLLASPWCLAPLNSSFSTKNRNALCYTFHKQESILYLFWRFYNNILDRCKPNKT